MELWKKDVDDSGTPHESRLPGTYTVQGRTVEVKLPGSAPVTGTLGEGGALTFPEPLGAFTDNPSECDA